MCVFRWREESKNLTVKFEETITALRGEVANRRAESEALKSELDSLVKQKEKVSTLKYIKLVIIFTCSNHSS